MMNFVRIVNLMITEDRGQQDYIDGKDRIRAIKYIDANLEKGVPVIAGVGFLNQRTNLDGADHFVVLVGKGGKGYYYLDPATWKGGVEHLSDNFIESNTATNQYKDNNVDWTKKYGESDYFLMSVAVYPKDDEHMNKIPNYH